MGCVLSRTLKGFIVTFTFMKAYGTCYYKTKALDYFSGIAEISFTGKGSEYFSDNVGLIFLN